MCVRTSVFMLECMSCAFTFSKKKEKKENESEGRKTRVRVCGMIEFVDAKVFKCKTITIQKPK